MLLAQLHGKVPSEFEGMEDVLTSSIFGPLKYLPSQLACELLARFAAIPVPQEPLELELWPRYPTPPGFRSPAATVEQEEETPSRGDTEPDAIVEAGDWLVLVEAKYRSPLDETYDQLGREFAVGYQLARNKGHYFRMLVVTTHTLPPTPAGLDLVSGVQRVLAAASAGLGDTVKEMVETVRDALYWTNWQTLYTLLSQALGKPDVSNSTHSLLKDMCRLLELRALRPYSDRATAKVLDRWENVGIPAETWSSPITYHYRAISSITAGWEQLLRLDTTTLHPVTWLLYPLVSRCGLATCLWHFRLSSLDTPIWHPYS